MSCSSGEADYSITILSNCLVNYGFMYFKMMDSYIFRYFSPTFAEVKQFFLCLYKGWLSCRRPLAAVVIYYSGDVFSSCFIKMPFSSY